MPHYFIGEPNFNLSGLELADKPMFFGCRIKINDEWTIRPQKDHQRLKDWRIKMEAVLGMKQPTANLVFRAKTYARNVLLEIWASDNERGIAQSCLNRFPDPVIPKRRKPKKVNDWEIHNSHLWR